MLYLAWMGLFLCVASVTPDEVADIDERLNFVEIELIQELMSTGDDNIVISPASLKVVLNTLAAGLGGRTNEEVRALLRLPLDEESLIKASNRLLSLFKVRRTGTELDLATRLWTGSNVEVNPKYKQTLLQNFDSDIEKLEFGDVVSSANTINEWVYKQTRGKIASIVTPGILSPGTKLMLTNALYLKGNWKRAFNRNYTHIKCFHVPNYGCQNSYLMQSLGYYRYTWSPELNADVLELPYTDERLSMLVMLPDDKGNGINGIARDLAHVRLSTIVDKLEETEVLVHMPRFTIDMKTDLKPALQKLGVRELFSVNADLSGIMNSSAEIDSILHNAKIEVNEEGTVAAAVTAAAVVPLMGSTVQHVRCDRPFIFILLDSVTRSILFSGRVTRPDLAPHPEVEKDKNAQSHRHLHRSGA